MSARRACRIRVLAGVFLAVSASVFAERPWLEPPDYGKLHVVAALDMSVPEQYAVRRFRMHWEGLTGHRPTIGPAADAAKVNVWVGTLGLNKFPEPIEVSELSKDGFVIRTLGVPDDATMGRDGRHLLLAGPGDRGTLYAEWAFFERYAGVRLFGPDLLDWPDEPPEAIPPIDIRYDPPFWYRDISYRPFMQYPWIAHFNRLNGHWSRVPQRWGGHIRYTGGRAGFAHTFHNFVDPDIYFDAHPEYFAEIDGERVKHAQLCLTNPDVLTITIDKVREMLRAASPNERIVSVSQMDYFWFDSWCTCANCRAIDEREESHAGSIIHFVNRVAEAIQDEFPDAFISTLAYMYSREPPKHLRPRDNVIVRLSAIECDYSRPMSDRGSPENRAFVRDLKRWRDISETLFVWNYTQNWYAFQGPHPNIPVLQPNLAFMARQGVDGVYEQASAYSPHSDFELLKSYLLARSVWNPDLDWRAAYREFLQYYYQDAAPYIDEYLNLVTERVKDPDVVLHFVNRMEWMDYGMVEKARDIFERAFAAIDDPVILERLRYAYLPVQYAALVCPPRVYRTADAYVFTRPPSQTFDEYWAMIQDYGVTHLNDYPIEVFRERLDGKTPPRYEIARIARLAVEDTSLWVVPDRGGAVVRWRNAPRGRDWLLGFGDIRYTRGRIQDWAETDPDRWMDPEPVEQGYDVIEETPTSIELETRLDNGLVLNRRMRVVNDALEVRLRVLNDSEEDLVPKAGIYGEFDTADLDRAYLWIESGGDWSRESFETGEEASGRAKTFVAEQRGSWSLRFRREQHTIGFEVLAPSTARVRIVHDRDGGIARLGAEFERVPLAPGEARVLRGRYTVTDRHPKRL